MRKGRRKEEVRKKRKRRKEKKEKRNQNHHQRVNGSHLQLSLPSNLKTEQTRRPTLSATSVSGTAITC